MITEKCPQCGNMVAGEFTPSATRSYLTGLAKTGGMKAVLAAVGSVVPGFGNIAGFLAGGAIDLIYGKDIKKLIDKVADEFDDNKVYVFNCPQCGYSWARKEDEIEEPSHHAIAPSYSYTSSSGSYSPSSATENSDSVSSQFDSDFDEFIANMEEIETNSSKAEKFAKHFALLGERYRYSDDWESYNFFKSAYFVLAGMSDLIYAANNFGDNSNAIRSHLKRARRNLKDAVSCKGTDIEEYVLIRSAIETLLAGSPISCMNKGTVDVKGYPFPENSLFNPEYISDLYERCRFLSLVNADGEICEKYQPGEEFSKEDREMRVKLWESGMKLNNKDYLMVCCVKFLMYNPSNKTQEGKYTLKAAKALREAVETEGYDIDNAKLGNIYYDNWLYAYVEYAIMKIMDTDPHEPQNIPFGIEMLSKVAKLKAPNGQILWPQIHACQTLGELYEDGKVVNQDLEKALKYYTMSGIPEEEWIKRVKKKIKESRSHGDDAGVCKSETEGMSISSSPLHFTSNEEEYLTEYRACLEEGGNISDRERRLLDRIRKSLGISEARARELEASCAASSLTDEEQEYADEIRACLEDSGSISDRERRLLNKLRISLGISESRASEIENMVK